MSKSSVPLPDHLARYLGMVTLLCYISTWHTFKQTTHDRSFMSVKLLSLTSQGLIVWGQAVFILCGGVIKTCFQ